MAKKRNRIVRTLLIESDPIETRFFTRALRAEGEPSFRIVPAANLGEAMQLLRRRRFEVVLFDPLSVQGRWADVLSSVLEEAHGAAVVVVVDADNEQFGMRALRAGAQDYILRKSLHAQAIRRLLERSVARQDSHRTLAQRSNRLAKSERKLQTLVTHSADGQLVVDEDGVVRYANKAAEEMFATSLFPLVGQPFAHALATSGTREIRLPTTDSGRSRTGEMRVAEVTWQGRRAFLASIRDITYRKQVEDERTALIKELESALSEIKALTGLIPICANCKSIRDDQGYWQHLEAYFEQHAQVSFSHGLCPDCIATLYPELTIARSEPVHREQENLPGCSCNHEKPSRAASA